MGRIICLDLGTKKTGIAISDPLKIISQALKIIRYEANDDDFLIEEILKIMDENKPIDCIVIGYPISKQNFETVMSKKVLKFKEVLENKTNLPIILQKETYSSQNANSIMTDLNLSKKRKKEKKDALAAQIILSDFLLTKN
ncbi:MAG: Holliday junction resolvase RuvX [Metamycoplasmataceae bacterium]